MQQTIMHIGSVEALAEFNYDGKRWQAHLERVLDLYTAEEWDMQEFNDLVMQYFSSSLAEDATVEQLCEQLLACIHYLEGDELSDLVVFEAA